MVIFAALFIVVITILFGAFGQRIQEFLQENALGTLLSLLSGISGRLRGSTEAEEDVEPLTPSPSSPTTGGSEFEVFISFRGEDTRKGFTGHLYDYLIERGVSSFMDSKKLEKGEEIDKLLEYIEKCKIFVPIFSKRYAESKWCLKEVTKSLECGQEIVPVFFGVEPSDVGNQRGPFKSAFRKHESNKKLNQKEVRKWREALKKVSNISGFNLKDMNGDEAKLRRAVIKRVLEKVNKKPLQVAKHPIGIETRVQDVKKMSENGGNKVNGVHVVGIHGMGGLGKTTIAKAVYNELAEGFNGATCFLSNVRENAGQHNGLVNLQKQLIHDILKEKGISISNVAHGVSLIKERASSKRVLLILDDVDSVEQLDALAGGRDWFGSGSVILITTRDEVVLLARNVEQHEIYKPEVLNTQQSRELFLLHAFNGEEPEGEYLRLSNEVVAAAGGLPLTIEVLGSHLTRAMDVEQWQHTLDRLKRIPPTEVQQRLKLSYDRLDQTEQKIFLDISCFFIGRDREYATYMWEACDWFPKHAIHVLQKRSLLKIDRESGEFEMHDQIRDMGRGIVKEECSGRHEKQSRLWNSQDSLDLLRRKVPGTIDAEAIRISGWHWNEFKHEEYCVRAECFENMPNLRYLDATDVNFQGACQCFPPSLKMLQLENCHFDPMPSDFNLEKAVVLRLDNTNMAQVFINQLPLKAFEKLKVLSIHEAEINAIPDLTNIPCLVKLEIAFCSKLTTIDESIGKLKNLTYLTLQNNEILGQLPDSIGQCTNLRELDMGWCQTLLRLPDSICQLSSLEVLDLEGCCTLCSVPERIGDMVSLKKLDLSWTDIDVIPDSICQLSLLESLKLGRCFHLCSLPERLGDMEKLEELILDHTRIEVIPDSVGRLTNLHLLSLEGCQSKKALPDSIRTLTSIQRLRMLGTCLQSCENNISHLTGINIELTCSSSVLLGLCDQSSKALKHLHLNDAAIEELPDCVGAMENLEKLQLECDMLKELPNWIGRYSEKLTKLKVRSKHLKALPDCIGSLKQLEKLTLVCENLKALPDTVGSLKRMRWLDLNCINLEGLPDCIGSLKQLEELTLKCENLEGLPDSIGGLEHIKHFQIESVKLKALPSSIALLKTVMKLVLKCPNLEKLPDSIGELESLSHFEVDSDGLICLPNSIGSLTRITRLRLNCPNLEALPDSMSRLEGLYHLILHCDHFSVLPDFIGRLKNLQSLSFKSKNLKRLHATIFGSLGRLKYLTLWGCENLEDLMGFAHLSSLELLDLTDCNRLECIPQLPSSLFWLCASRCTNLRTMSDVSNLKALWNLHLGGCKMLEDVPGLENISSNLGWLKLPGPCDFKGCCHLSQDFKNKVFKNKETTFDRLERFAISGFVVRGSTTGKQQLHFMLPKLPFIWLRSGWLSLELDKVVPPIHVLIMADDTTVFEKTLEVIEGNRVELNLRAESFVNIGEGEKEHFYIIQVTADVSQLEKVRLVLTQRELW